MIYTTSFLYIEKLRIISKDYGVRQSTSHHARITLNHVNQEILGHVMHTSANVRYADKNNTTDNP